MSRMNWTREESIAALALYCNIPFGKINKNHPLVIKLADLIGRTPSAVSMKMGNFGRFDPDLKIRGVGGLKNGSHLDEEIWNEFYQNMEKLYVEAEKIMGFSEIIDIENEINLPLGQDKEIISRTRKGQDFFRSTVLSAYNNICCITGLNVLSLLQACHIKSWKESNPETERTNPINGLCLNTLHHKAYDEGLLTINTDYRILISKYAKDYYTNQAFVDYFAKFEGDKIMLPSRFLPSKELIEFHNNQLNTF